MPIKILIVKFLSLPLSLLASEIVSIPMNALEKTPFYTVDVTVGKYGTTKMIVDTGASHTVLSAWYVEENKIPLLEEKGEGTDSGGRSFQVTKANIQSIAIGNEKRQAIFFHVVPTPDQLKVEKIGGILSPQAFFENQDFILDFPNKKILGGKLDLKHRTVVERLSLKPCSDTVTNKYLVKASLNGIAGQFYLDTGGATSVVTSEFSKNMGKLNGTTKTRFGVGSKREVIHVEGIHLKLGKLDTKIPVEIEPKKASCPTADGKLGNDFLKTYRMFFGPERKELILYQ